MTIYAPSDAGVALRQGEILSGLIQLKVSSPDLKGGEPPKVEQVVHPYAIVMTQDCDLDLDHRARNGSVGPDKILPSILFCEAQEAASLRASSDSKTWDRVKINKDERYHFLEAAPVACDARASGVPELGIDFKRYFTLTAAEPYARLTDGTAERRCRLTSPYLEHLSTRFCYFQFRVALPEPHRSV